MRRSGAGRRDGPRNSVRRGPSVAAQFASLFTGTDYFVDWYTTPSGTTGTDRFDPTHLITPLAGVPTVNAASANFANKRTLSLDGTVTLESNRAPSAFRRLSNGLGGQVFFVNRRTALGTNPQLFTTRPAGAAAGTLLAGHTGDTDATLYITESAGGTVYLTTTATAWWPVGSSLCMSYSYSETASPKIALRNSNAFILAAASTGTPTDTGPESSLRIGASAQMELAAVFGFNRVLTAAEYAIAVAGAAALFGTPT